MSRHHKWSESDSKNIKHCLHDECSVRVRHTYAEWQPRKGAPWCSIDTADIPRCSGTIPSEGKS